MVRKILAALAVLIEFTVMGGFVIPELTLPSRSALTQFFVMSSYVLLLKWTWCTIAGRKKKPETSKATSAAVERREQPAAARPFSFVEFMRRHSPALLIVCGILAAMLIAGNRYRILTVGDKVYRMDRFSGRCEMIAYSWGKPYFVPVREQGEKQERPAHSNRQAWPAASNGGQKRTANTSKKDDEFITDFLLSGQTL